MRNVKEENISLPLFVYVSKKTRKRWLTLNQYRNWHHSIKNNCKVQFTKDVTHLLDFKIDGEIEIEYNYYAPDRRKRDLMNVIAVVDKFFQDAMVNSNCIESDDTSIVKRVKCNYIGIDRENPRLMATIKKI